MLDIKGEEFETVIAFGLLEGYLPHWNDIFRSSDNGLKSANKLMYVICSRAKKNLHLLSERGRTTKGGKYLISTPVLHGKSYMYDK